MQSSQFNFHFKAPDFVTGCSGGDEAGNVKGQRVFVCFFYFKKGNNSITALPTCVAFSCLFVLSFNSWHLFWFRLIVLWFSRLCLVHVKKKNKKREREIAKEKRGNVACKYSKQHMYAWTTSTWDWVTFIYSIGSSPKCCSVPREMMFSWWPSPIKNK